MRFRSGKVSIADPDDHLDETSLTIPSDTLFSAIINHAFQLLPDTDAEKILQLFLDGKVTISGTNFFIRYNGEQYIWFVPAPLTKSYDQATNTRWYNQILFVSIDVLNSSVNGPEWKDNANFKQLPGGLLITNWEFSNCFPHYSNAPEPPVIYEIRNHVHNALPYSQSLVQGNVTDSKVYTQAFIELNNNLPSTTETGLYYLVEMNDDIEETDREIIEEILQKGGGLGFGGERNNLGGIAYTEILEFDDFSMWQHAMNQEGLPWMNLGFVSPEDETEWKNCMYYQTEFRGGQRRADQKSTRPYAAMIREGAVWCKKPKGKSLMLDEKVYRYGSPFSIPVPSGFMPHQD